MVETHKVEEEAIEAMEQDTDQMTVSRFHLSKRYTPDSDSLHMIKERKPLETTEKLVRIMKSSTDLTRKTKQVTSYDKGKSVSSKRRVALVDRVYDNLEAKSPAMDRAKEIQANLSPEFPSFIKTMLPSHVTRKFLIRVPKEFCHLHLLPHGTTVHLVDESGEEYTGNIHVERVFAQCQLSGGWRLFCIANKLLEGDVLIFQLLNPSKFKVYIVKANDLTKGDGDLDLLNLDARTNQLNFNERNVRPLPINTIQESIQQQSPMILKSNLADQSEIGSEDLGSEAPDVLVGFNEMGSKEKFSIFFNGSSINSELSEYDRTKYYELCCSQKSFLHNHLLETITCKLAAEIISRTVHIANAVRECKLSTSRADYSTWDKTLEAFELLGMNIGFLRTKISRLLNLAFESQEAVDSKRFREDRLNQCRVEGNMRTSKLMFSDLQKVAGKLDIEMETLKVNAERHEVKFQEEVNAPW